MNIQTPQTQTTRFPSQPRAGFIDRSRRIFLLACLGGILALAGPAHAGLISTTLVGPASAPYSYNMTIQFLNGNYYNFILRSTQATITGYDFLNTVQSLTPGMTVNQVGPSAFGYYVNGITIGSDANSGFANNSYWTYWNGTATNPVQWASAPMGESSTTLTPGQADGWVYGTGTNQPMATAFAVPEPGTWTCLALPLIASLLYRRVRRVCAGSRVGA